MVTIDLTEEQVEAMAYETKRTTEAYEAGKPGMFLLQVWPEVRMAEGGFVPQKAAEEIQKISREYHV